MKSKRQAVREQRKRRKQVSVLAWTVLGVAVLGLIGYAVWSAIRPAAAGAAAGAATGAPVPVMANTSHVAEGTDPGPFNSDPPTSGRHYDATYQAGFYNEGDPETQAEYPEGHLVHNLEHGYIIFWYDCQELQGGSCEELKSQIQSVMDAVDNFKVIAFPREALDVPVVMTSWGRMQTFEGFDPDQARTFVERNRNKAPEPNAP